MSDWKALLIVVIVAAIVVVVIPLFRAKRPWDVGQTSELDVLFEAKGRALRALKDLDHEREAGLLDEADWRTAREEQLGEAVRLNREIAQQTGVDPTDVHAAAPERVA